MVEGQGHSTQYPYFLHNSLLTSLLCISAFLCSIKLKFNMLLRYDLSRLLIDFRYSFGHWALLSWLHKFFFLGRRAGSLCHDTAFECQHNTACDSEHSWRCRKCLYIYIIQSLTSMKIGEGLYFQCSLSVCESVSERNSSQTDIDALIWTWHSLNDCLSHWLWPHWNWWLLVEGVLLCILALLYLIKMTFGISLRYGRFAFEFHKKTEWVMMSLWHELSFLQTIVNISISMKPTIFTLDTTTLDASYS